MLRSNDTASPAVIEGAGADRPHSRTLRLPRVSVIVPAYNAQETLARTLDALIAQTYPNWEAVVVDDGSTDRTSALAQEYAERDERIRPVVGLKAGVSVARNSGVSRARAEWLLFLDADDLISGDYLQKMMAVA